MRVKEVKKSVVISVSGKGQQLKLIFVLHISTRSVSKELIKIVPKRLFIYSIIFNTLYSIADYGEAFVLSYFGTSPLTLDKLIKLAICIVITHIIMLISGKIASYIDNINNQKK